MDLSVFLRAISLVLLGSVVTSAQTEKYLQQARGTYSADRYLLFVGQSPQSGPEAESRSRSGMEAQLQASLSDALSQSRAHAGNSSLARSASRMGDLPEQDWGRWIRIDQGWTTQRDGMYLGLAVVPLADLRNELERQYEASAVPFRANAAEALASASLAGFLENCKAAQTRWSAMVRQAILMACLVPLEDQGSVSLTAIIDDDRKHPYAPWRQDQAIWAKLEAARATRSKVQATASGPLSKQLLSASLPLLARQGIQTSVLAAGGKCRTGLLLTLLDNTQCEDNSMGCRCQTGFSWNLDECASKAKGNGQGAGMARGYKQGELEPLKVVHPVGEAQARRALSTLLASRSYDTLLVHSLMENLPSGGY